MSVFLQLCSLVWKNILLRRRQKVRCFFELVWPLFLFIILIWLRLKTQPSNNEECHFTQRSLPSVGSFAFIQSAVCSFDNVCHRSINDTQVKTESFSPSEFIKLLTHAKEFINIDKNVQNWEDIKQVEEDVNLSISESEHKVKRSIYKETFENNISFNKNNDYNQLPQDSITSEILTNATFSPRNDFRHLKFLKNDFYNRIDKYAHFLQTLRLDASETSGYGKLFKDFDQKNSSSFQTTIAAINKFLCGDQPSTLLNLVMNNKNFKTSSSNSAPSSVGPKIKEKISEEFASTNTLSCNDTFQIFEKDNTLKYVWWMLKPFVRGKLLYAPSTPATDRIMNKFQNAFTSWKESIGILMNEIIPALNIMMKQIMLQKDQGFEKSIPGKIFKRQFGAKDMNRFLLDLKEGLKIMQKLSSLQTESPNIIDILECIEFNKVQGFSDEQEALVTGMKLLETDSLLALVVFIDSGNETLNPRVTYKIRMDEQRVDNTFYIQDSLWNRNPRVEPFWDEKYIKYGFIYIQDMLDQYIIEEHSQKTNIPGIILQEFPFPCYIKDSFNEQISFMFPLIMVLSWSFTCAMAVKSIVYEKEKRLKETMKTMGLGNYVHWCGWFIDSLLSMIIPICLITLILKYGNILGGVSLTLLFVLITLYSWATISLAFLISTLFNRANMAAAVGGVIFFAMYIPYPVLERWTSYFTLTQKCLISLSSNVAFGVGSAYLSQYAEKGIGLSWENLFQSPVYGDNFSLAYVMMMLVIDIFIYLLLTFYIEAVFPGQYGIPKPWYFPFIRCSGKKRNDEAGHSFYGVNTSNYEPEPQGLTLGVSIKGLGLIYGNGKVAVNGVNLNFYEDQITSLLGHNGAGKTSTISVLTGLYPPTSGTVHIYEQDLHESKGKLIDSLGICPQHNIIFDLLTVEEHLWFYSKLRCQSKEKAKLEIELMIENIGLLNHKTTLAMNLSGGMQRKLSVAAAFIGGPKIVILDEPTSSVDPYSRRAIWDLLIKYKKGRTIILTTHSMDEADLLSDRIAIMVNGNVECCGTSLFLKDQFGSGFRLAVEMGNVCYAEENSRTLDTNIEELSKLVSKIIPTARLTEKKDTSISFTLPNRNDTKALQSLFSMLEKEKDVLVINSYNISDTSLEEIFLRVTEKTEVLKPQTENKSDKNSNLSIRESKQKSCCKFFSWNHFFALVIKRFHHTKRNKKALFAELLLPALLIYLAIFATSLEPSLEPRPSLSLNPWIYDPPRYMFYDNNATNITIWNTIIKEIIGKEGLGTKCLQDHRRDQSCLSSMNETWFNHTALNIEDFGPGCSCKSGIQVCPSLDKTVTPLHTKLVTGDTIFDLTGSNVSDFLIKTYDIYERSLFGGYSLGVPSPIPESYNYTDIYNIITNPATTYLNNSAASNDSSTSLNVKVWYNNKAWASSVVYMNAIKNVLLRSHLSSSNASTYGIDAFNHPMPYTEKQKVLFKIDKEPVAVFHAIALLFALSFVPASFTAYLVDEKASSSKHLQLLSGLSNLTYWLHIITWDLVCYALAVSFCLFSFLLLQEQAYISSDNLPGLISLLYMYGFSCIPLMYTMSFIFSIPSTAFVATACGNMLISLSTMIITVLVEKFADEELIAISELLQKTFIIFPHFALGDGIKKLVYRHMTDIYSSAIGAVSPVKPSIFAWDFLGKNLCVMAIVGSIFFLLIFLLEFRFFEKILHLRTKKQYMFPPLDMDEDVAMERKRINSGKVGDDVVVIKNLCKTYKKNRSIHAVVNHLTLGIKKGECFGLLGLNGAGKTVTLKMLSGKIQSSWGDAMINGWSVTTDLERVESLIGYCPQYDALDNLLTSKEHLEFYAKIRNIPCSEVKMTIAQSLDKFGLVQYKDCIVGTLSGGNKRKLSNAIAVLGKPPLLLLDEPTSGMDPNSRRFLRSRIKNLVQQGHSVILTSHSMEECQELCTRLTIMVNGQFKCLGSPQYLKNKYGKGYSLMLNCQQSALETVKKIVATELPGSILTEEKLNHLSYQLPKQTVKLINVFQTIELIRIYLKDFSVRQTTLEEVFLLLASEQSQGIENKKNILFSLYRNVRKKFSKTGSLDISI